METKKFWCHYIGSDGNTPKRRNIELTNLADLIPAIGDNTNCATPLWYEREEDSYNQVYYRLYAQLSENVAVYIILTVELVAFKAYARKYTKQQTSNK